MSPLWTPDTKTDYIEQMKKLYLTESIWHSIGTLFVCAGEISSFAGPIAYRYFLETTLLDDEASRQGEPSPETMRNALRMMNMMNQSIYTGWQFTSIEDRIDALKSSNKSLHPFMKDDSNRAGFHRIFCKFSKQYDEFKALATEREFMRRDTMDDDDIYQEPEWIDETTDIEDVLTEKYISVEAKDGSDDIVIVINVDIFSDTNMGHPKNGSNYNAILLKNIIAHELQHITEQFIFRNHNALKSKPNQFYADVSSSHLISFIDERLQQKALSLAYMLSPEERRARLTQLYVYLGTICDRQPADVLKAIWLNYKSESSAFPGKPVKENFMMAVSRTETIIDITKMNTFTSVVSTVKKQDKLCMFIGYFMEMHLLIKGSEITEDKLKEKLKKLYVPDSEDRNFIKKISKRIDEIYETYASDVNDTIYSYLERLMKLFEKNLSEKHIMTRDDIRQRIELYENACCI